MSRIISAKTVAIVRARARSLCEYCKVAECDASYSFQADRVIAQVHGGGDELSNLAWKCICCNLHKGPNLASFDPKTDAFTVLFNPRRDLWKTHFRMAEGCIIPKTARGRTTVSLLRMNVLETCVLRRTREEIDAAYSEAVELPLGVSLRPSDDYEMNVPLDSQELIDALERNNVKSHFESSFKGSGRFLKRAKGRIICAEFRAARGDWYGISFWIYKAQFCWYLGLWSGKLYQINCTTIELSSMVNELFSGGILPSGKTPSSLPAELMEKHSIVQID